MQPPAADNELEAQIVNHVPDEVCIRIRTRAPVGAALYEEVRRALNDALANEFAGGAPDAPRLKQRFGAGPSVLQPLERYGISAREHGNATGIRPPWVAHADSPDETIGHVYYAVGPDRVEFANQPERNTRLTCIRELTNLFNRHTTGSAQRPLATSNRWTLLSGQPNWLTIAAPFGCGSPAGLPVPEPRRGTWRFRFDPNLESALPAGGDVPIVVAILDTCPDLSAASDRGNPYLADVLQAVSGHHVAPPSALALHSQYFNAPPGTDTYLNSCLPWWHDALPDNRPADSELSIADHGLFVAGIVHSIAPLADIHIIRVLDDFGVGDALALDHVLHALPDAFLAGTDRRQLIVNLSLGTTVPVPPRRQRERWFAGLDGAQSEDLLKAAHESLWSTMNWLHRQGVLVVAAAGNDALRPQTRDSSPPPPRYPARYQEVFAVAAASRSGAPSSYSNRADVKPLGNGITSFGGEVVTPRGRSGAPVTAAGNAVVGVYSTARFANGQANETGWAQWAGTSFSAPIVTGISARLWADSSAAQHGPTELMERVLSYTRPVDNSAADPDGPLDAPFLAAWQEP